MEEVPRREKAKVQTFYYESDSAESEEEREKEWARIRYACHQESYGIKLFYLHPQK